MDITYKTVLARVGGMSLVGVGYERPCSWGNYFTLRGNPEYRVVNFWAENLDTLVSTGVLTDGMVNIKIYDDKWCLILDDRIPDNWYHYSMCFTGGYRPDLDIIKDMFATRGDPEKTWKNSPILCPSGTSGVVCTSN